MLKKTYTKTRRSCRVTFKLPADIEAESVAVLGEFNEWQPEANQMTKRKDGTFSATLSLPVGSDYRFRYLLDGERWINDEQADDLVINQYGTQDGIITI